MVFLIFLMTLVELLKTDEKKAVKEILKKFMPDLIRFLSIKLAGNDDAAEELFQETAYSFINAVYKKRVIFFTDAKIKHYLFTVAMNAFRNYYKKNKNVMRKKRIFKSEEEMTDVLNRLTYNENNPEENTLEKEKKKSIQDIVNMVMAKLTNSHSHILKLKFTDDKSNHEIAAELKISVKAAESLLFRAKQAFKREFEKFGIKDDIFFEKGGNNGQEK